MFIVKNAPPFFNVVADGLATLELPKGDTYHRIVLKLGGGAFTKAMITQIRCKLNGKIFYEITGARLDAINQQKGLAASASYLTIDFNEPNAKAAGGMYLGAIGTLSGVTSFTIEVTIAGATTPTLSAQCMVSAGQALGAISGIIATPQTVSAAGEFLFDFPHGPSVGHSIKRTHIFHTNLTHFRMKKNGLELFEKTPLADYQFMQAEFGQTAQSGLFTFDPVLDNNISGLMNTANAQTLEFWSTVSAADTLSYYTEVLNTLDKF